MNTQLTVGTIFKCSWGYEQTNVDYYQVIGVTSSGKSVKVRQIDAKVTDTGNMTGTSLPIKDTFTSGAFTRKLNKVGETYSFKVNSFSNAYVMDDITKPSYVSWYH